MYKVGDLILVKRKGSMWNPDGLMDDLIGTVHKVINVPGPGVIHIANHKIDQQSWTDHWVLRDTEVEPWGLEVSDRVTIVRNTYSHWLQSNYSGKRGIVTRVDIPRHLAHVVLEGHLMGDYIEVDFRDIKEIKVSQGGHAVPSRPANVPSGSTLNLEKETYMSSVINTAKAVQEVTFVYGQEVTSVSDDTLVGYIRRLEDNIKSLEELNTKSTAIDAKVKGYKAEIDAIVKVLDSRAKKDK